MILVHRPTTEPRELARQRRRGLERALDALNAHGQGSKALNDALTDYDGGRTKLFRAQHRKCAYCERRVGLKGNVLEHIRPKGRAWRHMPGTQPIYDEGYWWLTWAWKNHLFACASCNTGYKKAYFPLAQGSAALQGPSAPYHKKRLERAHLDTSIEAALLVDPSVQDPLDHIEWRPVNQALPKKRWTWFPKALTQEGDATIAVLGLADLADDVGDHLRDNALARTSMVCEKIDVGQFAEAAALWDALTRDLVRSDCHLAGPTWNALHYLVDARRRTTAQLVMPARP